MGKRVEKSWEDLRNGILSDADNPFRGSMTDLVFVYARGGIETSVTVSGNTFIQNVEWLKRVEGILALDPDPEELEKIYAIEREEMGVGVNVIYMRDAFLAVETQEDAISFLRICGPFSEKLGYGPERIEWSDFKKHQSEIKSELLALTGKGFQLHLDGDVPGRYSLMCFPERKSLIFLASCETAMESIEVSVVVDRLRRATFKECPWCGKIFEVRVIGGHEKSFCTPIHGRMAGIYEKRKAERVAKLAEKPDKRKTGRSAPHAKGRGKSAERAKR